METHILVVDDEPEIADLVEVYLKSEGYQVHKCFTVAQALACVEEHKIDLAILDVMMPRMDGFALTRKIRETSGIPLIILSAKGKEEDRVRGLETGADVYMTKPFQPGALVAQVQASLRRAGTYAGREPAPERWLSGGGLWVDLETLTVSKNGETLPLTSTELKLLLKLMKSPGRVFTKAQLYSCLNGEGLRSDDNTIMVHISNLREKIEVNPKEPKYIKVVWGIGYKMEKYK